MSKLKTVDNSRRAFFLKSGTALGVGLASTTAAAASVLGTGKPTAAQLRLATLEEQAAIRQLHLVLITSLQRQDHDSALALFTDNAYVNLHGQPLAGKAALQQLLMSDHGQQPAAVMHTTFRQDEQADEIEIYDDHLHANACFHLQVQAGNSTPHRWQDGWYEVDYFKVDGQWRISDLVYQQA